LSEKPTGGKEKSLIELLRSDPGAPSSKLLSSNLRRALSTMAASFRYRLKANPDEKILVVPSLQEISRNPDTLSITPAQKPTTPSFIDKETKICDMEGIFVKQTDMSLHLGNKPMDTNGLKRMSEFCDFAFTLKEEALIIGGHSIWFRSFFKTYLPYSSTHVSKSKKVVNAGCIAFTLLKTETAEGNRYMIDENSLAVVYGGFK